MAGILTGGAVAEYLQESSRRPFVLGTWDCFLFCVEWVQRRRGVDAGSNFRGHYRTRVGATRILTRRGGMAAHFAKAFDDVGLEPSDEPRSGDVALVSAPEGETGAIVIGNGFTARLSVNGFRTARLPILKAWRV